MKILILSVVFTAICSSLSAQKLWTLKECINHAIENNIQIQQSELTIEESKIILNTASNSRLPSLGASMDGSVFFGRGPSRDGTYIDNTQASANFGINLGLPVYEGGRIKNDILSKEFSLQASVQGYEGAKENLSLSIVSLYMQILFNKELLNVSKVQLDLSAQFLGRNKVLFKNGRVPESEYYESLSLMAKDKLTVTEAENLLVLSLLDLAQALNLPSTDGFDIVNPEVNGINGANLGAILTSAEQIYNIAVESRPSVLGEKYRLKSFEKQLKVANSAFFPRIGFSAGYNNSYFHSFTNNVSSINFAEQVRRNGNQSIGLGISIPIFSKFVNRNQVKLAQLSIQNQSLVIQDAERKLQKEIEQSSQNTRASKDKYRAASEALNAAQIAFQYEDEKAKFGRSTIFDFNDSKTRLTRSESELIRAKYEFLFNKKILDFYLGIPLTN